jgi:hypothetical protein
VQLPITKPAPQAMFHSEGNVADKQKLLSEIQMQFLNEQMELLKS